MKLKLPIINTLLLIAILTWMVIGTIDTGGEKREAYVVTGELFNAFDYQKELDNEYKTLREAKMKELEMLKAEVLMLEEKARINMTDEKAVERYQYRYNQYLQLEAGVNEELAKINNQYSTQIWDKLNALVARFGEENNYEVIFGAGGSGNIMYAEQQKNITQELIAYCNLKYNGK